MLYLAPKFFKPTNTLKLGKGIFPSCTLSLFFLYKIQHPVANCQLKSISFQSPLATVICSACRYVELSASPISMTSDNPAGGQWGNTCPWEHTAYLKVNFSEARLTGNPQKIRLNSPLSFLGLICQGMELTHCVANANRHGYVLIVHFHIVV